MATPRHGDAEGRKIGELEAVYFGTGTDEPAFATGTVGMPTRRRLDFVPVDQAIAGPAYVRVGYDRKKVKDAFDRRTAGRRREAIFRHHGLAHQAGAGGERRLGRR